MKRHTVALACMLTTFLIGCDTKPITQPAEKAGSVAGESSAMIASASVSKPNDSRVAMGRLNDPPTLLSETQLQDGWITLFDGKTLFGWTANSDTNWAVEDGEIVSTTPAGLLLTTTRFQNYELRCEVRLEAGGNSGLFLRTVPEPKNPAIDCLEFNLCDGHARYPTGSLVGRAVRTGEPKIEGGWHSIEVVIDGEHITAKIDGRVVLDSQSPDYVKTGGGHIGLQQNGGEVRFRNIFLRPLGTESIFSSSTLDRWRMTQDKLVVAEADENAVRLRGEGYLESQETYDDFVLQFEAKLNAKDVNSGLFFRAEPSTAEAPSNGYELQLQNTVANGDRTQPADYGDGFGTGAIFRRQRARYVNADDQEWFAVTLVADGNHFASWVNGLQVTDFRDERSPDQNPRKGRRGEAGHLSFQGHDATTDASFRAVRIARQRFQSTSAASEASP